MEIFIGLIQESISGIALGSIYALIALGFTLIYKATEVVNFAQGELMMVGAYINFYFVDRTFSDVYLFQDSLKNSIEFLKRAYSCDLGNCTEDDGSELDFF